MSIDMFPDGAIEYIINNTSPLPKPTRLIGVGGKLRSGKDTVADYLVEEHGWVKMGMSDALADALYELNPLIPRPAEGWPGEQDAKAYQDIPRHVPYQTYFDFVGGYVEAKTHPEVRRLLQILGTEVGRKMIDENVWTNILKRRIAGAQVEGRNVILTGVRYENELEMIHGLGGQAWWVERPGLSQEGATATHSSENTLGPINFDLLIVNAGTLTQLYAQVERELQDD